MVETASLNELELSEYCRRKGFYPAQISTWRNTCLQANASVSEKDRGTVRGSLFFVSGRCAVRRLRSTCSQRNLTSSLRRMPVSIAKRHTGAR